MPGIVLSALSILVCLILIMALGGGTGERRVSALNRSFADEETETERLGNFSSVREDSDM